MFVVARHSLFVVAAGLALVVVAACTGGPPDQSAAEAACSARGLTRGTIEFDACLHPSEAKALEQGEDAWQQIQDDEE